MSHVNSLYLAICYLWVNYELVLWLTCLFPIFMYFVISHLLCNFTMYLCMSYVSFVFISLTPFVPHCTSRTKIVPQPLHVRLRGDEPNPLLLVTFFPCSPFPATFVPSEVQCSPGQWIPEELDIPVKITIFLTPFPFPLMSHLFILTILCIHYYSSM